MNLPEQRDVELRHVAEFPLEIVEQVRLMEQLRAVGRISACSPPRSGPRAAEPAAQADQLREFFVVHFVHRLLDAVLRPIEFLAHAVPVPLSAASVIAFACGTIEFPTPIPLARPSTRCPISFTLGASSACTAMKPSAITAPSSSAIRGRSVKLAALARAHVFLPVHAVELVQRAEDFVRQRHHHIIDVFESCFTSMCDGASAARQRWRTRQGSTVKDKLRNDLIRGFDC